MAEAARHLSRTLTGTASVIRAAARACSLQDVVGLMAGMDRWQGCTGASTTDTSRLAHTGRPSAVSTPAEHGAARGSPPRFDPKRANGGTESRSAL
jgi:hypothetical protein